jgi:hypothetical protein
MVTKQKGHQPKLFPNAIIQWNMLPQTVIASTSSDCDVAHAWLVKVFQKYDYQR